MVRNTSRESYRSALNSGLITGVRERVYKALYKYPNSTGSELYKAMGGISSATSSNITTRLGELRTMGVAKEVGSRRCKVTGQTVTVWATTDSQPSKLPTRTSKSKIIRQVKYDIRDYIEVVNTRTASLTRRSIVSKLEEFANRLGDISWKHLLII